MTWFGIPPKEWVGVQPVLMSGKSCRFQVPVISSAARLQLVFLYDEEDSWLSFQADVLDTIETGKNSGNIKFDGSHHKISIDVRLP